MSAAAMTFRSVCARSPGVDAATKVGRCFGGIGGAKVLRDGSVRRRSSPRRQRSDQLCAMQPKPHKIAVADEKAQNSPPGVQPVASRDLPSPPMPHMMGPTVQALPPAHCPHATRTGTIGVHHSVSRRGGLATVRTASVLYRTGRGGHVHAARLLLIRASVVVGLGGVDGVEHLLLCEQALRLERSNAAGAGTGDGLAVLLVRDVSGGKDTLDRGLGGAWGGNDVAVAVEVDLALDKRGGGQVADGVEEAVGVHVALLARLGVLDAHGLEQLAVTLGLGGHGVEVHRHLGMRQQTLGHDLGRTQLVSAHEHVHVRGVLGEVHGLLGRAVTAADDDQRLVAEDGHGTVADGTGRDTALPVGVLARKVHALGAGTGGDDEGIGELGRLVLGIFAPELEGARREIELGDGLGVDLGAEADGLCAELVHDLGTTDAIGEAGEVLDVGGGGELSARGEAVGEHALEEHGLEVGTRQVDGGGVTGRAGADDDDLVDLVAAGRRGGAVGTVGVLSHVVGSVRGGGLVAKRDGRKRCERCGGPDGSRSVGARVRRVAGSECRMRKAAGALEDQVTDAQGLMRDAGDEAGVEDARDVVVTRGRVGMSKPAS
ncbi:hypothetical protein L1887_51710 [Cichorium endivia]|nr:hypothetical protein L1887_51710 [Cichorium endivia]